MISMHNRLILNVNVNSHVTNTLLEVLLSYNLSEFEIDKEVKVLGTIKFKKNLYIVFYFEFIFF